MLIPSIVYTGTITIVGKLEYDFDEPVVYSLLLGVFFFS